VTWVKDARAHVKPFRWPSPPSFSLSDIGHRDNETAMQKTATIHVPYELAAFATKDPSRRFKMLRVYLIISYLGSHGRHVSKKDLADAYETLGISSSTRRREITEALRAVDSDRGTSVLVTADDRGFRHRAHVRIQHELGFEHSGHIAIQLNDLRSITQFKDVLREGLYGAKNQDHAGGVTMALQTVGSLTGLSRNAVRSLLRRRKTERRENHFWIMTPARTNEPEYPDTQKRRFGKQMPNTYYPRIAAISAENDTYVPGKIVPRTRRLYPEYGERSAHRQYWVSYVPEADLILDLNQRHAHVDIFEAERIVPETGQRIGLFCRFDASLRYRFNDLYYETFSNVHRQTDREVSWEGDYKAWQNTPQQRPQRHSLYRHVSA
jgi:hypothetical protein